MHKRKSWQDSENIRALPRRGFLALSAASGALLVACDSNSNDLDGGTPMDGDRPDGAPSDGGRTDTDIDAQGTDAGPIVTGPDGPKQFLTWDGGTGPTKDYWNAHLGLAWNTPGTGDWIDAAGTSLGDVPYASVVHLPGLLELDVSSLVERWLSGSDNRGFYLRTDQDHSITFVGRAAADGPRLVVETASGPMMPPCTANAQWTPTSYRGADSRGEFGVSGVWFSIVQFDLSTLEGVAPESARLVLNCTQGREGTLEVFEADPPTFRVGGGGTEPLLGLAAGYSFDEGLDAHPSVLFAADFSQIEPGEDWSQGGFISGTEQINDPETRSTMVRSLFQAGETFSSGLERNVVRGAADGTPDGVETELYARYYVYLEADWGSTIDGNKMPGWDCRMGWWNTAQGGYWQSTTGNGGSPGSGLKVRGSADRWEYEGHSMRGLGGPKAGDGNYYDDFFWLRTYMYNLDQEGAYGSSVPWPQTMLGKEQWFCIEQYVKMNTIVGPFDAVGNGEATRDGVYRVWVDGVLAAERSNLAWTRHPELGLQGFWLNWYHGGTVAPDVNMHYRMNHVVIARDYVGPRVGA